MSIIKVTRDKDSGSWVISLALGALGLTDDQKAIIEAAIPDAQALITMVNGDMAVINAVLALVNNNTALAAQVLALVNTAWPHIQKLMPAAKIIVDALAAKQSAGDSA